MFWNAIDNRRQSVLKKIITSPPVPDCYLAGGTGLALLIGHRESIDFDWFSMRPFSVEDLHERLSSMGNLTVNESKSGTFHGMLDD